MMKATLSGLKVPAFLQILLFSFTVIIAGASSTQAQGICVSDTLSVTSITGTVLIKLNSGESPVEKAVVKLRRGNSGGPVIAIKALKEDANFNFAHIKPGKYHLTVTAPALYNFYLDLVVKRPKSSKKQEKIIIFMGTDLTKPCHGSSAELRTIN